MPTAPTTGETPAPRFPDRVYPDKLQAAELALFRARRQALGLPCENKQSPADFPDNTVGFALSGGGIRSATFCLGVFQALARLGLLRRIDFLSTVSGGGYFGSFYGAWLNRGRQTVAGQPRGLVGKLRFWQRDLRQGTPVTGHFDKVEQALHDPASFQTFWLRQNGRYLTPNGSGDAVLAGAAALRNWLSVQFVLAVFLTLIFCVTLLPPQSWWPDITPATLDWCGRPVSCAVHWSRWFWAALVPLAPALVLIIGYWVPGLSGGARNRYTRQLANCLYAAAALGGFALLDSAGGTLWACRLEIKQALCTWVWEAGGVGAILLFFARKGMDLLTRLSTEKKKLSIPVDLLVTVGAVVLAILWLAALDTVAHVLHDKYPLAQLGLLALALYASVQFGFLNLSSLANLYGSRLTRAYVGASNPARQAFDAQRITETIPGDIVPYETYAPEELGGPLHLINITVNETVDGRSETEQLDRKGFNLALGPAGISAAAGHHALWAPDGEHQRGAILPLANGGFNCLANAEPKSHPVEQLELGQWVGISGAAFSTGLGARTNPGMSFLCGFFNIRLGWWWDSGVAPSERFPGFGARLRNILGRLPSRLFPVQAQLVNEFRARFYGSARRHWYLSDGGHFENTAAYELVRRRLPFIVICDDGCDPQRQMEDFANLVRKARLDFDAEIEVLEQKQVPEHLAKLIGGREHLSAHPDRPSLPDKCALLARVTYRDNPKQDSLILLIKPTVIGRESADILNYHVQHGDFPQESTLDQFFDEAQWESYRKLGDFIATGLFEHVPHAKSLREAFTR